MDKFFRILGYLIFAIFLYWVAMQILGSVYLGLGRYFRLSPIFTLILLALTAIGIVRFVRPKINLGSWDDSLQHLGYLGFGAIVLAFVALAVGFVLLRPTPSLLTLMPILSAIFIPRLLWMSGLVKNELIGATLAVVLGFVCFTLAFWGFSNALGEAIVEIVAVSEERNFSGNLRVINSGSETAVTQTLTRLTSISLSLNKSCPSSSPQICDQARAAAELFFVRGPNLSRVYVWLIGLSLILALVASGLTFYYINE